MVPAPLGDVLSVRGRVHNMGPKKNASYEVNVM